MSGMIKIFRKSYSSVDYKESLKMLTDKSLEEVVDQIKEDGCYIFDKTLPKEIIDSLEKFAEETPVRKLLTGKKNIQFAKEKFILDVNNPESPRYQYDPQDVVGDPLVQEMIFNQAFLAISNEYFGSKPIFDRISMWWSLPFGEAEKSNAAQLYHFDLPRFQWIKFFIYLTDVHEENGPHCFVKKSHKRLPKKLRKDGRMDDELVRSVFGSENMIEIEGKRGTVIAADTRALHKGKPLTKDHRLLLQLQFANALYGGEVQSYELGQLKEKDQKLVNKYTKSYKLITTK
ncbi:MAG: phytanoyl-CoA dioxygenase family protein [Crocinitomicaceae bacterium]